MVGGCAGPEEGVLGSGEDDDLVVDAGAGEGPLDLVALPGVDEEVLVTD